jgi:hypothetical protein
LAQHVAALLLLVLVGSNGAGLVLAYAEAALASGERCERACCRLSRSGPGYAASCCAVRCGKDVNETGSEPARERSSLAKPLLTTATLPASDRLIDTGTQGHRRNWDRSDSQLLSDSQPDLNVQHSVFLV